MLDSEQIAQVTSLIADAAAAAAVKALKEANVISDASHLKHHSWIDAKIIKEEAMAELIAELAKHVTKWGVVGVLSFIFYGLYLAAKEAFRRG